MTKSAYIGLFSLLVLMVVVSLLLHSIFVNPTAPTDSLPTGSQSQTAYTGSGGSSGAQDGQLLSISSHSTSGAQAPADGDMAAHTALSAETVSLTDRRDAAPAAQPIRHTIVKGDNYYKLAEKYYGSPGYYRLIEQANPDKPAGKLKINDVVIIPPRPQDAPPRQAGAAPQPKSGDPATAPGGDPLKNYKTYVVQGGDGFRKIAREQLGDESKWRELYELNRRLGQVTGENDLRKGQKIALGILQKP